MSFVYDLYLPIFTEFSPDSTVEEREKILSQVLEAASKIGVNMTDELTTDTFFAYIVSALETSISSIKEQMFDPEKNNSSLAGALQMLNGALTMFTEGRETILESLADRDLEGRELLVGLSSHDPDMVRILRSKSVFTMGDFLIAVMILKQPVV